jgi:predicted murein hydrolase (TIGR00659 family)
MNNTAQYLIHHPLFGLFITLLAFWGGQQLYLRSGKQPWLQPVLVGISVVIAVLLLFDIPYAEYQRSAYPIHVMIGPVTVALAVPLYLNIRRIQTLLVPILLTLLLSGILTVLVTVLVAWLIGVDPDVLRSLTTKSITTPIALMVAKEVGGIPALAAAIVLITGVIGAVIGPPLMTRLKISDDEVLGITLGMSAHAIGTAKALEISPRCGAFSALAMGLTGIMTAVLLPAVVWLLTAW